MFAESKTKTRLQRRMGEAIETFRMIEDGDRVMVCLSGGKDSHALLDLLLDVQKRAPVKFDLLAVNLDQKQPNFPAEVLPKYLSERGVPFRIVERNTYAVVKRLVPEGKTFFIVPETRIGKDYLFSTEKLGIVLSIFRYQGFPQALEMVRDQHGPEAAPARQRRQFPRGKLPVAGEGRVGMHQNFHPHLHASETISPRAGQGSFQRRT